MQHLKGLTIVMYVIGLAVAPGSSAHPYEGSPANAPLVFVLHFTDDGRPIYTNIPKRCFTEKRLSCPHLHPIFNGPGTIKKPQH